MNARRPVGTGARSGRREYRDAVEAVTALLARRDPLGIGYPTGDVPSSEYEPEAAEIVRHVVRIAAPSAKVVAGSISTVFEESFGVDDAGGMSDYLQLAVEVMSAIGIEGHADGR